MVIGSLLQARAIIPKTIFATDTLPTFPLFFSEHAYVVPLTALERFSSRRNRNFVCPSLGAPRTHQMEKSEETGYQCCARGPLGKFMVEKLPF